MRIHNTILVLAGLALLTACGTQPRDQGTDQDDGQAEAAAAPESAADDDAPVSILRPDIEQPDLPPAPLEPLNTTIGFPDGGSKLDADAVAALEQVLASEQLASGGPIVLGSHSDAGGNDAANMRVSEARGMAVAKWLIDNGVDETRVNVIVFGEQNPVEPNALPDGSPNESGRAANRRVEVRIVPLPDGGKLAPAEDEAAPA